MVWLLRTKRPANTCACMLFPSFKCLLIMPKTLGAALAKGLTLAPKDRRKSFYLRVIAPWK